MIKCFPRIPLLPRSSIIGSDREVDRYTAKELNWIIFRVTINNKFLRIKMKESQEKKSKNIVYSMIDNMPYYINVGPYMACLKSPANDWCKCLSDGPNAMVE